MAAVVVVQMYEWWRRMLHRWQRDLRRQARLAGLHATTLPICAILVYHCAMVWSRCMVLVAVTVALTKPKT